MITEDYVSYELAKLLKEKGFDGYCLGLWHLHNNKKVFELDYEPLSYDELREGILLAPTHQMAMKWLREVHKLFIVIEPEYFEAGRIIAYDFSVWCGDNYKHHFKDNSTYEEAVEAALKYSLENLI